jgi:hypothetical protein
LKSNSTTHKKVKQLGTKVKQLVNWGVATRRKGQTTGQLGCCNSSLRSNNWSIGVLQLVVKVKQLVNWDVATGRKGH